MSRAERVPRRASGRRTIVVAGMSSVMGTLPVFLVGGLSVFIRDELGIGPSELGLVVATFFLSSAVTSAPGGRMTERIGARRSMLAAAAVAGLALLGIGLLVDSLGSLALAMAIAGVGNGIAQPAGNLAIARGVANGRQGLAFGMKQAAIPTATLVAGFLVAAVGVVIEWRAAFVLVASGAIVLALLMPEDAYRTVLRPAGSLLREGDVPLLPLIVLSGAAFCGAAVGTSLASFIVGSAVDGGVPTGTAGLLLIGGSVAGILSRLAIGRAADLREGGHLEVVMLLLGFGALGFAGLALRGTGPMLLASTVLAFAAGWGWPGLFNFAVVRLNPNAPAAATAITQTGVFIGGVVGPAAFGRTVDNFSYEAAWVGAAATNVVGVGFIIVGRSLLRRAQDSGRPPSDARVGHDN